MTVLDILKKNIGAKGKLFAFEFFLELNHDSIILQFKEWLKPINCEDVKKMVSEARFPEIDPAVFSELNGYEEFVEKITASRLFEAIAEARPDLARAISECELQGAEYLVNLRADFINKLKSKSPAVKKEMSRVTCDVCGKTFVVSKEEACKITECPFCKPKTMQSDAK